MAIILNENDYAAEMIRTRDLGRKPSETLRRVARYYIDQGYSKKDARTMLDKFLIQCDPYASLVKWSDTLDFAVRYAAKYPAVMIDYIDITVPEMEIINSIKLKQGRRLAFTLLCLAKYWNIAHENNDNWTNNTDAEIMSMANINTSSKRQGEIFHQLYEDGLIRFSVRPDNPHCKILFMADGETALRITDFRNLGYQYLMYMGQPYFKCENCGLVTKYKTSTSRRRQKYCPSCAIKIQTRQKVDYVMRKKEKKMLPKSECGVI